MKDSIDVGFKSSASTHSSDHTGEMKKSIPYVKASGLLALRHRHSYRTTHLSRERRKYLDGLYTGRRNKRHPTRRLPMVTDEVSTGWDACWQSASQSDAFLFATISYAIDNWQSYLVRRGILLLIPG